MHVFKNTSDTTAMVESISFFTGVWNGMIKGLLMLSHLATVTRHIDRLQATINSSWLFCLTFVILVKCILMSTEVQNGRIIHYIQQLRRGEFCSRIVYGWITFTGSLCCIVPFFEYLNHAVIAKDLTKEMYRLPTEIYTPYDIAQSPAFEITYLVLAMSVVLSVYMMAIVDSIYLGVCTVLIACQNDLLDMLENNSDGFDGQKMYENVLYEYSSEELERFRIRLKQCLLFHYEINE